MPIKLLQSSKYVFPIIGGTQLINDKFPSGMLIKQVYGTAFHIGEGFFLTSGHVIPDENEKTIVGLGFLDDRQWMGKIITNSEIIPEYDLGILEAQLPEPATLIWDTNQCPMLQDVLTVGFPYALDLEHLHINVSSFKGYIVSALTSYDIIARPGVYELSFNCPRGLSGAPLIVPGKKPSVTGVITGNRSIDMLILMNTERVSEGSEIITERYESLQLGIALQSRAILDVSSELLGTTLGLHLLKADLISGEREK